jgi:hypothetical protein
MEQQARRVRVIVAAGVVLILVLALVGLMLSRLAGRPPSAIVPTARTLDPTSCARPGLAAATKQPTPTSPHLTLVSHIGGIISVMQAEGDLLYLGEGGGLTVLDATDARRPVRRGRVDLGASIDAMQIVDHLAYLATTSGLQIVDLRDPDAPTLLSTCATQGQARNLQVVGRLAFVAHYDGPLQIIDVSDPARPTIIGSFQPAEQATKVAVSATLAYLTVDQYLTVGQYGLLIVDVRDPTRPTLASEYTQSRYIAAVQARGSLAYLASEDGLQILDLSNPTKPRLLSTYREGGAASGLQLDGDTLSLETLSHGTLRLDVRNPAVPTLIAETGAPTGQQQAIRSYSIREGIRLCIVDRSDPQLPRLIIGSWATWASISDVHVVGTTAYFITNEQGLQIVDLSQPSSPVLLGGYAPPETASALIVVGSTAYIATLHGIEIVDVSAPTAPRRLGRYDDHEQTAVEGLRLDGSWLYFWRMDGVTLHVLDVDDPTRPQLLGSYQLPPVLSPSITGVVVAEGRAYVATNQSGLQILDVHDPAAIRQIGEFIGNNSDGQPIGVGAVAVDPLSGWAYLIGAESGQVRLLMLDVRDPAHPRRLGAYADASMQVGSGITDLRVVDGMAYLVGGDEGIFVIDVRDPVHPVLVEHDQGASTANHIEVAGDWLYADSSYGGLVAFWRGAGPPPRPAGPAAPAIVPSTPQPAPTPALPQLRLALEPAGVIATLPAVSQLAVADRRAFVAAKDAGLRIFDLSNPEHPTLLGAYRPGSEVNGVDVLGARALISAGEELQVLDISDPHAPVLLGTYRTPGPAMAVQAVGKLAYVSYLVGGPWLYASSAGVMILDVSDPARPLSLSQIPLDPAPWIGVHVADGRAMIVCWKDSWGQGQSWSLVDVRDPQAPISLSTTGANWLNAVQASGDYAYVLGDGLMIVDLHDPRHPTPLGSYAIPASTMDIQGDRLYVVGGDQLRVLDISDPTAPQLLGSFTGLGGSGFVRAAGDLIVIASDGGMRLLRARDEPVR